MGNFSKLWRPAGNWTSSILLFLWIQNYGFTVTELIISMEKIAKFQWWFVFQQWRVFLKKANLPISGGGVAFKYRLDSHGRHGVQIKKTQWTSGDVQTRLKCVLKHCPVVITMHSFSLLIWVLAVNGDRSHFSRNIPTLILSYINNGHYKHYIQYAA